MIIAVTVAFAHSRHAAAQVDLEFVPTGTADYGVGDNWMNTITGSTGVLPDATFNEIAVINNGGTAFLSRVLDPNGFEIPGGIELGQGATDSGTLEVRSGGSLTIAAGMDVSGNVLIGQSGRGTLRVLSGGTLESDGALSSGGSANSLIHLGETGGPGTATLTVNAASNLNRTTRITGPNVNYTTNSLNLGAGHNLIAEITSANHSAINVNGAANLDGMLTLEFNGVTPGQGDAWPIISAGSLNGTFSAINTSATLPAGFGFFLETSDGDAQIAVDSRLQLSIDRRTGAVSINNLTDPADLGVDVEIDGYFITSLGGTLDAAEWNRLGDADWIPSDFAGPTHVGELTLSSQRVVGASEHIDLGNLYANIERNSQFGVAVEDAKFEYSLKDGEIVTGLVDYFGAYNNVVLVVDPESGDTWMQNQSTFDVDIDGYEIESISGALDPSQWTSLTSTDAGWTEANPIDVHIGELRLEGTQSLIGESEAISLGQIFTPGSNRDLVFTFTTPDFGGQGPMTFTGIVEYDDGPIDFGPGGPGGIDGDYSGNGLVEQADLDLVLGNWGQSADNLPATWINDPATGFVDQNELDKVLSNWGASAGLAGAAAVPEPSGCALALVVLSLVAVGGRVRKRLA